MKETTFKKMFYNSVLVLFLMGMMVMPMGSLGFFKVTSPSADVLSLQDVRESDDAEAGVYYNSKETPMSPAMKQRIESYTQVVEKEDEVKVATVSEELVEL